MNIRIFDLILINPYQFKYNFLNLILEVRAIDKGSNAFIYRQTNL